MPYAAKKIRKPPLSQISQSDEPVTFEKYYEIVDESVKAELLDGRIIRDSPAIPRHGDVCLWIGALVRLFVERFDLGKVNGGTTTVRLTQYQGPEPDVFFIHKSRLGIVGEKYITTAPDLCIEVISKSSRKRDRGRKFVLYADHGVKEYWIIDPLSNAVDFYENKTGEWIGILPDKDGRLHSKVLPGFWFDPRWLAPSETPPLLATLNEILGIS